MPQGSPAGEDAGTGPETADRGDSEGGGLSWLTNAAVSSVPATTVSAGTPSMAEVGLAYGNDWLAAANASGQTKRNPCVAESITKATAAPASPGGWMSSGKLGFSTEVDSDEDDAGTTRIGGSAASTAAAAKRRNRKKTRLSVSGASGPGGWLRAGTLGVPTGDGNDDGEEEEEVGSGDGEAVGITIETQTEDDIEAVTEKGGTEKTGASKLPPWAKPWVPPPKPQVVPDPTPEVTSAAIGETKKKVV